MERSRVNVWGAAALLSVVLLLPAKSGWAQCFECFCNTIGDGVACTSNENLATRFCTTANTGCDGYGNISTTACTSLPFSNCTTLIPLPASAPAPAPALGGWQLALVALLLAGAGSFLVRRRTT
jgi:hypothetical protein